MEVDCSRGLSYIRINTSIQDGEIVLTADAGRGDAASVSMSDQETRRLIDILKAELRRLRR